MAILFGFWMLSACTRISVQTTPLTSNTGITPSTKIAITSPTTSTSPYQTNQEHNTELAVALISKFYTLIAKDEFVKAYELYYYPNRPYSNDFTAFIKANLYPDVYNIDILDIETCCADTLSKVDKTTQNFEVSLTIFAKENKIFSITQSVRLIFFDNRWQIAQIQDLTQNFPPTRPALTLSVFTPTPSITNNNRTEFFLTEKEKTVLLGSASISKFYTLVEIGRLEDAYSLFSPISPSKTSLENFIAINLSDPSERVDITNIEVCCEQSLPNDSQMQKFHVTLQVAKLNQVKFDPAVEPPSGEFEVFMTLIFFDNQWQIYQKATSPQ
ncbi:MAG TPA: hypothetical protein PK299_06975 [Anaerolineales bacterium]|nr:hypothetical protein [Anaerolineales bacterium]